MIDPHANNLSVAQLARPQAMRIVEVHVENSYTKTFVLEGALAALPGQFVMVWLPDQEDKPFSLVNTNPVTLTIAAVGHFTQTIHQQQVGDLLWLRGPYGQGYRLPKTPAAPLLLIGESYFVGSLLFLARQAKAAGHPLSLILLAPAPSDLTLAKAFAALKIPTQIVSELKTLAAILPTYVTDASPKPTIFGSGPAETLRSIAEWATHNGVPTQLAWKAPMKCGLGVCGSCELGSGWLTCVDGPVFPFNPLTKSLYKEPASTLG